MTTLKDPIVSISGLGGLTPNEEPLPNGNGLEIDDRERQRSGSAILEATNISPQSLSRAGSFAIARPPGMKPSRTLFGSVGVCLFSPLLFGYCLGFTSPAQPTMQGVAASGYKPQDLTVFDDAIPFQASAFASIINIGCLIGAFLAPVISDRYGRTKALAASAVPMVIAYLLLYFTQNWMVLTFLRLLMGIGVGMGSATSPCYIGEVSTLELRGALGACNQLAITIGIFFANYFGTFVFVTGETSEFCQWRDMALFGAALATCIIFCAFIPESPRFYAKQGNLKMTRSSLMSLREVNTTFDQELMEIINQTPALARAVASGAQEAHRDGFGFADNGAAAVVPPTSEEPEDVEAVQLSKYWKSVSIGIGLLFFQQLSGCNAIIFFVSPICKSAGMTDASLAGTVAMGAQVVCTLIACLVMEKAGRRTMLIGSMTVCGLSHVGLATYYLAANNGYNPPSMLALVFISGYIIGFSFGLGPIPWLMLAELFPTEVRGVASSIAIAANWLFSFLVTLVFDSLMKGLGEPGTFALFAIIVGVGITTWVWILPETRGKNIEEVLLALNGPSQAASQEPSARAVLLNA